MVCSVKLHFKLLVTKNGHFTGFRPFLKLDPMEYIIPVSNSEFSGESKERIFDAKSCHSDEKWLLSYFPYTNPIQNGIFMENQ